jgi:hypothetical protein
MKNILKSITIILGLVMAMPAMAQSPSHQLGTCLIDSINGKERKQLAKWIFFAIAAHPEISSYAKITPKDVNKTDQYIGGLITRMLVEDCPTQLKAAQQADPMAIRKSFELVGKVAMQELMTNKNVTSAITNYAKYADQKKIQAILK